MISALRKIQAFSEARILVLILVQVMIALSCRTVSSDGRIVYLDTPVIDSVTIALPHSGEGYAAIAGDSLVFFDKHYFSMHTSAIGNYVFSEARLGLADTNLLGKMITSIALMDTTIFLQANYTIVQISRDGRLLNTGTIRFPSTQPMQQLESEPGSANPAVYEPDYIVPSIAAIDDSTLILNITAEHPFFNAYTTYSFYNNGHAAAAVNLRTNRVYKLFGKRKGPYLIRSFIPFFHSALITCNRNTKQVILGYEADPVMYVYDQRFTLLSVFGTRPARFNDAYPLHTSIEVAFDAPLMKSERMQYGRFEEVIAGNDPGYVVRRYKTGIQDGLPDQNRLQVFRSYSCIKDILLPAGCRIAGIHKGAIYGFNLQNNQDSIRIYTLSLDQ